MSSLATVARSLQDAIGSLVPAVEALTTRVNTPPRMMHMSQDHQRQWFPVSTAGDPGSGKDAMAPLP